MHELQLALIVILLLGWDWQVEKRAERNSILRMLTKSLSGSSWVTRSCGLR